MNKNQMAVLNLQSATTNSRRIRSDKLQWNRINDVQKTDKLVYNGYTGSFASFFQTGDPNAHKITDSSQPGVPSVKQGGEFVIKSDGFANTKATQLDKRCAFWQKYGSSVPV